MEKPFVWQMIKDVVDNNPGPISYSFIKKSIIDKWGDINLDTITAQIIALTVNHHSRIHYSENSKPKLTNSNSPYDLLFTVGSGQVVKYNVLKHGLWEVFKDENDKLGVRLFQESQTVNTYLFVWNPEVWKWIDLEQNIENLQNSVPVREHWSCSSYKKVKQGDRAFLMKVGKNTRGIMGSATIVSKPFYSEYRKGEDKAVPRMRVILDFDVLLNPEKEPILAREILNTGNLVNQQWSPQSSGISIRPELVDELESLWFEFLTTHDIRCNPYAPIDNEIQQIFTEGTSYQIVQNRYERNPHARKRCIEHYGYSCSVCAFNFEENFGELGRNFIHIHHLNPIAKIGEKYQINPIKDLRPVCPNCHAMLHKQNPPLTIDSLKLLYSAKNHL